jgi:hypothetical protein
MTFRTNYFTPLTFFCGALAKGATPVYVAPVGAAPHIVGRQARAVTYDRMCGALAKETVAPLRKAPHRRVWRPCEGSHIKRLETRNSLAGGSFYAILTQKGYFCVNRPS